MTLRLIKRMIMNHKLFRQQIKELYKIVQNFEDMFPGRPFTPDGHMVGSIGECMVADAYGLELMPPGNGGFDAKTSDGLKVEIKATQSNRVAFRSCPEHTIIIQIMKDGTFKEYYNGPGELIWKQFKDRNLPSNGQYQISLSKVQSLNKTVNEPQRVPLKNKL